MIVPQDLTPGKYVLSLRWDVARGNQVEFYMGNIFLYILYIYIFDAFVIFHDDSGLGVLFFR